MAVATQKIVTDLFDQAVETFNGALKTGLKVQEEATKWWLDAVGDAGSVQKVQQKVQEMVVDAIPAAQQNAEEYLKTLDRSCRSSLDLLKKAYEPGQCESVADCQAKTRELWEASLGALRTHAQAMVQLNGRIMESCNGLVRKTLSTCEIKAPAAAH